jgi:hypothetical protein
MYMAIKSAVECYLVILVLERGLLSFSRLIDKNMLVIQRFHLCCRVSAWLVTVVSLHSASCKAWESCWARNMPAYFTLYLGHDSANSYSCLSIEHGSPVCSPSYVDIRWRANTTRGLDFEHMIKARAHKGGVRIGKTPKKLASICCP